LSRATSVLIVLATSAVIIGTAALLTRREGQHHDVPKTNPLTYPDQKKKLEASIARHVADRTPRAQDELGRAHIELGFLAAKKNDFDAARAEFKSAVSTEGTGKMSPDFGGINDQAAYQAAVCLIAQHKDTEAEAEFRQFIKRYPLSPLIFAAYKRVLRIRHGNPDPSLDKSLQSAVSMQEARIRFETSACGPKAIEYILPLLSKSQKSYKSIAKLCGTNDDGTTLDGMCKGLKALGLQSFCSVLNRTDFAQLPTPSILLRDDHYVVVLQVFSKHAKIYDPRNASVGDIKLPDLDDPKFLATVLTFQPPTLSEANS
jgi:hypothetical protein